MIDKIKTYLVEVLLKKMGPSLLKGIIASGLGLLAAHQGALNGLGVTWDPSGHTIDIDLDALSAWVIMAGSGSFMALLTGLQHHTVAAVTDKPQSGDVRENPDQPVSGGKREGDPPKA